MANFFLTLALVQGRECIFLQLERDGKLQLLSISYKLRAKS